MLKAFQYGPALNAALQSGNPSIVVSLIDELIQRSGLRQALHNRDDASLEPILRFVVKYIANPSYSTYMADLALMLLEIYTPVIGQSPAVDQLLTQLTRRLTDELRLQDDCTVLQGELDLILASVVPDSNMSFEMND
jgi:U3 small nucleolar RNA-associated protein 15